MPARRSSSAMTARAAAAVLLCASALLPATAARAHHLRPPGPDATGIAIPGLTHGQLAAVALNKPAILDLAARQPRPDATTRRLAEFVDMQSFACLWSLVPGSLSDEHSPFNECTHAALAGTLALYRHVRATAPADPEALALDARLQRDLLENSAALVLCRFGDEPFNTAELIQPSWSDIAASPPAALTLAGLLLATAVAVRLLLGLTRPAATAS